MDDTQTRTRYFAEELVDWSLNSDHLVKRGLKKYFRVILLTMGQKISQSSPFLLMTGGPVLNPELPDGSTTWA